MFYVAVSCSPRKDNMESITLDAIRKVVREEIKSCTKVAPVHEGPLLTTSEAADYIGMSVSTLVRFRTSGRGPKSIRYGRPYFYRKSDLDEWVSQQ